MIDEISNLFRDINPAKLRVTPPTKVVFLCGGVVSNVKPAHYVSLRDYLCWAMQLRSSLDATVVLAEQANQLYRDTAYDDLITFEEDIAKISAMILLIAESPGSLAELGAFASNAHTRPKLRLILQQKFANSESFIRFGPVERIKKHDSSFVGFYPWRTNKIGNIILRSTTPHRHEIISFITEHISATHKTELMRNNQHAERFFIIYWIIYICFAASLRVVVEIIDTIGLTMSETEVRNIMYCLQLVGWIRTEDYSGKEYFYAPFDKDPFDYAFRDGVSETDSVRRKLDIAQAIKRSGPLPRHVKSLVSASRARK